MKSMYKHWILTAAITVAIPCCLPAQNAAAPSGASAAAPSGASAVPNGGWTRDPSSLTPKDIQQRQLDALSDRLELTADQQKQVSSILVERDTKIGALSNDASLVPEDRRSKTAEITQESWQKVRSLLTADQQTSFDEFLARQRHPRGPRPAAQNASAATSTTAAQNSPDTGKE